MNLAEAEDSKRMRFFGALRPRPYQSVLECFQRGSDHSFHCFDKVSPRVDSPGLIKADRRCLGCDTHQTVALDIVRRPKTTPIHELERYMRCKDCSQVRGYPYKRSHLVALRTTKISASDPPSTWWPGER